MYVPFWLFDGKADANLRFRGTRVRTWSDSDHIHTETSHYAILREGNLSFADVPVDGSTKMPDDLMESIEPFDWKQGVDFQTAYLAGYLADKYDQDAETCAPRANERIKNSTQDAFRETVKGYNTVVPEKSTIHVEKGHVAYALLPVWTMTTKFREKTYLFAMNGQTGKFVGNLPIDPGRFAAFFAGIAGGVAVVSYVLGLLTGLI